MERVPHVARPSWPCTRAGSPCHNAFGGPSKLYVEKIFNLVACCEHLVCNVGGAGADDG